MEERVILENKNLIYAISNYFPNYKSKDDLFQVGCIGLLKAYKNFDESKGVKFSTYAYSYIYGEMRKLVREDRGIKVGRDISMVSAKIEKVSSMLSQKLMREPTNKDIAEYLEIPIGIVDEARRSSIPIKSIDDKIGDTTLEIREVVSDRQRDINTLMFLREEVSKLSNSDQALIKRRFVDDYTQNETAKSLGITQVQVSRSEQKILKKLKEKITC